MVKPARHPPATSVRREIAARVRELRQARHWSQAHLAGELGLSQNRLSEIERGGGSFTAEQFLQLLKLFNAAPADFVRDRTQPELELQNALARLGAAHLNESTAVLPGKDVEHAHDVVQQALLDGTPRLVTALGPVLVRHARAINLSKIQAGLERIGRERRLPWTVDNVLVALDRLAHTQPAAWAKLRRHAHLPLEQFLEHTPKPSPSPALDLLDSTIRTVSTLDELAAGSSPASKRWGIATSIDTDDFVNALKASRVDR
jgi:transcriptional regulator with XRE-family HTH domain